MGAEAVAAPAAGCLFTAVHAYPYYFPHINALSLGRPAYALVNDSNVDWNQSLPEVKLFAEQHGLGKIDLDEHGFLDPAVWAPQAQLWNCQTATDEDGGQGVTLSAILILDGHNCAGWTATAIGISSNWRDTGCRFTRLVPIRQPASRRAPMNHGMIQVAFTGFHQPNAGSRRSVSDSSAIDTGAWVLATSI